MASCLWARQLPSLLRTTRAVVCAEVSTVRVAKKNSNAINFGALFRPPKFLESSRRNPAVAAPLLAAQPHGARRFSHKGWRSSGPLKTLADALPTPQDLEAAISGHLQEIEDAEQVHGGADHTTIAAALSDIGRLLQRQGDSDRALDYHRQSLAMTRRLHGDGADHPNITVSLTNIGTLLRIQGAHDEALAHYRLSLEMKRRIYGARADNLSISGVLHCIGTVLRLQGNVDEAIEHYQSSLAMARRVPDANFADIAVTLGDIGNLLQAQGEYEAAFDHYMQRLAIEQQVGGDTPGYAGTLHNLGVLFFATGDGDKAQEFLDQSLAMKWRMHGSDADNIVIAQSLSALADVHRIKNDLRRAYRLKVQSLEMEQRLGRSETIAAASLAELHADIGELLSRQGKTAQGVYHYRKSLEFEERLQSLGPEDGTDSSKIMDSLGKLALALEADGQWDKALQLHCHSLEMTRRIHGDATPHPSVSACLTNIGHLFYQLDKFPEALEHFSEALAVDEHLHGPSADHMDLVQGASNVANVLVMQYREREALSYYSRALSTGRRLLDSESDDDSVLAEVTQLLESMGLAYARLGQWQESLEHLDQALILGDRGSADTSEITELIANVKGARDRAESADR